ncbi:hypothetical protein VKT23_019111 [Stygiomarasmius scandens]|uniref:Cyclin N-terminal domain-containing protein n=1 Tax=Marasmiellus scandens TaxID=2682957 RepID=A0ABR1IRN7_9AGAR
MSSAPDFQSSTAATSPHSSGILVSAPLIDSLVDCTFDVVYYAINTNMVHKRSERARFTLFVKSVLRKAEVTNPVAFVATVYINRIKFCIQIAQEEFALERVFLGALVVASKYLNDSTLKNCHWAICTRVFNNCDINLIEREFLEVIDWELRVYEEDLRFPSKSL